MSKKQKRPSPQNAAQKVAVETPQPSNGPSRPAQSIRRTITGGPADFNPDYAPIVKDLKRIGILAGSFFVVLIVLSFFLR